MQKIFYLILSLLFLSSFLKANTLEHSLPREVEEAIENDIAKQDKAYGVVWFCNSRYVGPLGYGAYYGYAVNNRVLAAANALTVCRSNHIGAPQFCILTNCYYRYW